MRRAKEISNGVGGNRRKRLIKRGRSKGKQRSRGKWMKYSKTDWKRGKRAREKERAITGVEKVKKEENGRLRIEGGGA